MKLGMPTVSNFVKFDAVEARDGVAYAYQIGEHGPVSPFFCPKSDSNPTTITINWGAGGQTWLDDPAAYSDCWWLSVAAQIQGYITIEPTVATYLALQGEIDWNGHINNRFSLRQDPITGQGPRVQDFAIGLKGHAWAEGPVLPDNLPADFWQVVEGWQNSK